MDIHTRIKMLRLLCGMTQEELAFKAEVPRPSLGNYEQGTYVPRDKSLERLAAILGVEPGYLRYGSPVLISQAWLPAIPVNARRRRETIEDILRLLPDFIVENRFDSVISRPLGDGGRLFFLGRNNDYTCMLLAAAELADSALKEIKSVVPVEELLEDANITIATFSARDIELHAKYSGHKGWKFDVEGMCRSLEMRRGTGKEIKKEPLSFVLNALLLVSREYDLPLEAVSGLVEFSIQKYTEVAPLPTNRISATGLMRDIRTKIESLGGTRHEATNL